MNTPITTSPAWPLGIERDLAGRLGVMTADGERVDLGAFKDDCRRRAVELRQQAVDDALAAGFAALRRPFAAAVRLTLSRRAGIRVRQA
jgi:hypothetical protein